jgi:hypothetical protein
LRRQIDLWRFPLAILGGDAVLVPFLTSGKVGELLVTAIFPGGLRRCFKRKILKNSREEREYLLLLVT